MTVRVLVADDHPILREGLCSVLAAVDGVTVVGQAAGGEEAVAMATALAPDVVVMDLRMPDLDGVEATRRIVADRPATAVVVLTMFADDQSVLAALRAGARGYLVKGATPAAVSRAVVAAADGESVYGAPVAALLAAHFAAGITRRVRPFPLLTEREEEVLALVAEGHDNRLIARQLGISAKTARNHVSNVFTKLGVPDRARAIVRAREAGLGVSLTPGH